MFRNVFNEPKPHSADEITEALDERGISPREAWAEIDEPDPAEENTPFKGWTAEVAGGDVDVGDGFSTRGFATKDALLDALRGAGITEINER